MPPAALFLIHAALVIGLPYALWRCGGGRWAPLVVIQILAGLALGPTGLGHLAPSVSALLFPAPSLTAWNGLVWLGVTFFAFATGLHFDVTEFKGRGRSFAINSSATFVIPTLLGLATGGLLLTVAPQAAGAGTQPWVFALGVGIAIGVTALPVLAAILREMDLSATPLGAEALGCAAVNDAALWLMVAVLLAASGGASVWQAVGILAGAVAYGGVLWLVVRPLLARCFHQIAPDDGIGQGHVVLLSVGLFASAFATEWLGLHAVVGAFAFGAVVPKTVARVMLERFESFLMVVLLPFFFMSTGLKTDFAWASGAGLVFALTAGVSVLSKMASAAIPARIEGWPWRQSCALGALVGCKGLMELVVLTLLLERGIISESGFSGMVLMALVTTALARPLTKIFLGR